MYWKKSPINEDAYIFCSQPEEGFEEMDDSLFGQGFNGCYYLKTFLANPSAGYLNRKKKFEADKEIVELKSYLASTDYVIAKLNELKLEDEAEYEKAKAEYADVLIRRKQSRIRINELA